MATDLQTNGEKCPPNFGAETSLHEFCWKLALQEWICQMKLQMFFKSLYNFAQPCILPDL